MTHMSSLLALATSVVGREHSSVGSPRREGDCKQRTSLDARALVRRVKVIGSRGFVCMSCGRDKVNRAGAVCGL